jgi:hypothetical protein
MKTTPVLAFLLVLCATSLPGHMIAAAEADKPAASAAGNGVDPDDAELTPEEKAEKEGRKACKIDVCRAFHSKDTTGSNIACHVIKSWRKEALVKLVGKLKVTWPYGAVHCFTDLSLKRADLGKALAEPKAEVTFDKHTVTCSIASEKSGETEFKFELAPKVAFENGKATKAQANWGKIEAPTLIKSALWTATGADNTINLLSGAIVDEVNAFLGKRCDEVKDQWAAKQ